MNTEEFSAFMRKPPSKMEKGVFDAQFKGQTQLTQPIAIDSTLPFGCVIVQQLRYKRILGMWMDISKHIL